MFERKKRSLSTPAYVVSTNGDKMTIELKKDMAGYKMGQTVVATVSTEGMTSKRKPVIISDVVAQGSITDIKGNHVTIRSNKNNPIISQRAAAEAKKSATEVIVRVVQ